MTTKISGDNISAIANTGVTWNAVTVADGSTTLNASSGNGYFLDTNAGTIDVNLPTSPTRGDTIIIADYGNNFATNRVIINTGGKLIDSTVGGEPGSGGFTVETNGAVVELVFADNTAGWIIKQNNAPSDLGAESYAEYISATGGTITTSGDYKIHTFTGDGCFVVSSLGNPIGGPNSVDYLVVAGGGGGGSGCQVVNDMEGGGGGAGGLRFSACTYCNPACGAGTALPVSATTYPITVGAGGGGSSSPPDNDFVTGCQGSNSVFSTITSTGGGGGGSRNTPSGPEYGGQPGGSGGGAGQADCGVNSLYFGTGNTPPTSPPQGNPGGQSSYGGSPGSSGGGGGGGAGQVGQNASGGNNGGAGGAGKVVAITGSNTTYAGGGGGAGNPTGGSGGTGGGGNGGLPTTSAGTANTGGGGGGGGSSPSYPTNIDGAAGGKGIVIIRYKFK